MTKRRGNPNWRIKESMHMYSLCKEDNCEHCRWFAWGLVSTTAREDVKIFSKQRLKQLIGNYRDTVNT